MNVEGETLLGLVDLSTGLETSAVHRLSFTTALEAVPLLFEGNPDFGAVPLWATMNRTFTLRNPVAGRTITGRLVIGGSFGSAHLLRMLQ